MKNIMIHKTFLETIKETWHVGGGKRFNSLVIYKWRGNELRENLSITFNLEYNSGWITLSEGEKINSDVVYMEFRPDCQEYEITGDGFLKITGETSPNLGRYEVLLVPVEK
jgi:hypothetical protein